MIKETCLEEAEKTIYALCPMQQYTTFVKHNFECFPYKLNFWVRKLGYKVIYTTDLFNNAEVRIKNTFLHANVSRDAVITLKRYIYYLHKNF